MIFNLRDQVVPRSRSRLHLRSSGILVEVSSERDHVVVTEKSAKGMILFVRPPSMKRDSIVDLVLDLL
jgi:hypothetical protein